MQKRAKIICTIGPTSNTEEMLTKLARSGMDVARLNFSHGTHEGHLANIKLIRKVSKKISKPIAILMDLQGPKIRIGHFAEGCVTVKPGELFTIVTDDVPGTQYIVSTSYKNLPNDVKPDDNILINDGLIQLKVDRTTKTEVFCEVVIGGILYDRKGINLPGVEVSEPSMTKKDIEDLKFGLKHGVDYVALSFVREAQDIRDLRNMMGENPVPIIAKIEKPEAVKNIDEIIMETDAAMVARGDLGVEISAEKVPVVQKMIIEKCMTAGIPVITATQMLDSMMANPVPTRAEASDVANAVFDGTDAVMLSGETAFGKYPLESVSIMASIIREAEKGGYFRLKSDQRSPTNAPLSSSRSICHVANISAQDIGAKYIVVFTESGFTGQIISKYRPKVPVLALTQNERTFNRMALLWGVIPSLIPEQVEVTHSLNMLEEHLKNSQLAHAGDKIILIAGSSSEEGGTNMMRLHRLL
jgi:pyruvate kinase